MDVLSDVLRVIRLKGSLYVNAEFREPWCVTTPPATNLDCLLSPGSEHLAISHLIVEGHCWAQLPGALAAGDVVVLPQGDAHLLGSGLNHAPLAARDAVEVKVPDHRNIRNGGSGAATRVVCGCSAYEGHVASPLMTALPRLFRSSICQRPSGAWLENSIRYALGGRHPGDRVPMQ